MAEEVVDGAGAATKRPRNHRVRDEQSSFRGLLGLFGLDHKAAAQTAAAATGVAVFEITPVESKVKFYVDASSTIEGTFSKWDAALIFTSTDVTIGVLDVKIQADSVDTGSGVKGRLKGGGFFDVKDNPYITFHSTKVIQTYSGNLHDPRRLETRNAGANAKRQGDGFRHHRRNDGLRPQAVLPFIKIADRVEVDLSLKGKRVSGPPVTFKQ